MQINETTYNAMPAHLRALFVKLPNPGKDEVLAGFPQSSGGAWPANGAQFGMSGGDRKQRGERTEMADSGSAARFFYCAKASRADRNAGLNGMAKKDLNWSSGTQSPGTFQSKNTDRSSENYHPTVKPTDLMRYLCRLVTPPKGIVLDPFMGSGSTGKAAVLEGFSFVGMELNADYFKIAQARVSSGNQSNDAQCELFDGVQP